MWSLIEDFVSTLKSEDLKALRNVDKLDNVILLEENKCNLFNELKIWFQEEVSQSHHTFPPQS